MPDPAAPRLTQAQADALLASAIIPCPHCGCPVVPALYVHQGGPHNGPRWVPQVQPLSPVRGEVHVCRF